MQKENKTTEFKETITNTFLKTVSAYSNYNTGIIIFGINDNGEVVGISDLKQSCLDIENKINDSISPKPDFSLESNFQNNTITLTVYEGKLKPYLYKGKAYKRNDTCTIEIDQVESKRLILESSNISYEDLKSNNQNLHFNYLSDELKKTLNISNINSDTFKTLRLMSPDGIYNIAAELFSEENQFSGIDIVRFGDNINIFRDRNRISNKSILAMFDESIKFFKQYYVYEEIIGSSRKSKELIPESAFREAIANALVHRVWDINSYIKVSMWDDYIEICSPGGLPYGMNQDMYLKGNISITRNPIIASVFFRLNIIEQFGTGIKRIVKSYEESLSKPQFLVDEDSISIKLPLFKVNMNFTSDEEKVYSVINNRKKSSSEIIELVGFGKTKTIKILNSLVERGLIYTEGSGRAKRYLK